MNRISTFLTRKVGPAPLWVWAIIAAIVIYVGFRYFRNRSSGGSSGGSTLPGSSGDTSGGAGTVDGGTGTSNPGDSGGSVGSIDTAQLASDLAAALQDQMPQGGFTGDRTPNPDVPVLPGTFPEKPPSSPGLPKPKPHNPPKKPPKKPPKTTPPPKKPPHKPPRKYYTYRKDVPLKPGQTVHYLPGKGYYAA